MSKKFQQKVIELLFILFIILAYQLYVHFDNNKKTEQTFSSDDSEIVELDGDSPISSKDFQIYFIDVGQGDSILIQSQGKYALVDAGNNKDGKKLVNYFKKLGTAAGTEGLASFSRASL